MKTQTTPQKNRMDENYRRESGWLHEVVSWPSELLKTLKAIEARLASIEETQKKLDRCMDSNNHRRQMCVKTGHWND